MFSKANCADCYRRACTSVWDCLHSWTYLHNETGAYSSTSALSWGLGTTSRTRRHARTGQVKKGRLTRQSQHLVPPRRRRRLPLSARVRLHDRGAAAVQVGLGGGCGRLQRLLSGRGRVFCLVYNVSYLFDLALLNTYLGSFVTLYLHLVFPHTSHLTS